MTKRKVILRDDIPFDDERFQVVAEALKKVWAEVGREGLWIKRVVEMTGVTRGMVVRVAERLWQRERYLAEREKPSGREKQG